MTTLDVLFETHLPQFGYFRPRPGNWGLWSFWTTLVIWYLGLVNGDSGHLGLVIGDCGHFGTRALTHGQLVPQRVSAYPEWSLLT